MQSFVADPRGADWEGFDPTGGRDGPVGLVRTNLGLQTGSGKGLTGL